MTEDEVIQKHKDRLAAAHVEYGPVIPSKVLSNLNEQNRLDWVEQIRIRDNKPKAKDLSLSLSRARTDDDDTDGFADNEREEDAGDRPEAGREDGPDEYDD
jgi:hypothetical protein